ARRQEIAREYADLLGGIEGLELPVVAPQREHVWHLYVVRHDNRDALAAHLADRGIQTAINYPTALPFLPAYRRFEHVPADFPSAYADQRRILSLPLFPEMSRAQIDVVADALRSFAQSSG